MARARRGAGWAQAEVMAFINSPGAPLALGLFHRPVSQAPAPLPHSSLPEVPLVTWGIGLEEWCEGVSISSNRTGSVYSS